MAKIIVGLGNPGEQYAHTRHNVGFMALDMVAQQLGCQFRAEKRFAALVAVRGEYILLKPQTYMNESGQAVRSYLQYYRQLTVDGVYSGLAVLYDDLDIPFGGWKWQFGRGPKAHNGVNSVVAHLGSDQFWHGRIGTENRTQHRASIASDTYVLAPFADQEQAALASVLHEVVTQLLQPWPRP